MTFDQPVIHIMTKNPISIKNDQKLSDAKNLLSSGKLNHLPVVDGEKLVGIISSNDLVKLSLMYDSDDESLSDFLDRQYTIDSVMQKHPISVGVEATVREAARLLSAGGFHALPVIGYDGALKGIVTSTDMINLLITKL